MDTVSVNEATPRQLRSLLGLTPDEVRAVIAARPFTTEAELVRALPSRVALTGPPLTLVKRDINAATTEDLVEHVGLPRTKAEDVLAHRPYFMMLELAQTAGLEPAELQGVMELYVNSPLIYTDKLSRRPVVLVPKPTHLLVTYAAGAAEAEAVPSHLRLRQRAGREGAIYKIFEVDQSETGLRALTQLKRSPEIEKVVPSFMDADGVRRFFDPELCVVQFSDSLEEAEQQRISADLEIEIAMRHRTPGLVTVRVPGAAVRPAKLFAAIEALNGLDAVLFAEPAFIGDNDLEWDGIPVSAPPDGETAALPWNLEMVRAAAAWVHGSGSERVVIALIDTGVERSHPAISHAVLERHDEDWNFSNDDPEPVDQAGHGTFIAGLLVGNLPDSVRGLSPGCRILPLRVPLTGSTLSYAARRDAILYALDYIPPDRRLILNLSWKTSGDIALIRDALMQAVERDALVVCSAGNWPEGPDQPHFPSDYPGVVSVGAVGPDRERAPYSFYGREVDLAAPGGGGGESPDENLMSAAVGGGTRADFGTSFAAPHVAALAALVWSQNPDLRASEVRRLIESTAVSLDAAGLGHGVVDAAAAVAAARTAAQRPRTGNLDLVNSGDVETLIVRFGLARLTARLLVARRPFTSIEQLRGTLGLGEEQFAAIAGTGAPLAGGERPAGPLPSDANRIIAWLNSAEVTASEIDQVPGMPTLTARLIVARRPHDDLATVTSITGMTPELLERLPVA